MLAKTNECLRTAATLRSWGGAARVATALRCTPIDVAAPFAGATRLTAASLTVATRLTAATITTALGFATTSSLDFATALGGGSCTGRFATAFRCASLDVAAFAAASFTRLTAAAFTTALGFATTGRRGITATASAAESHSVQQLESRGAGRAGHTQQTNRHQGGEKRTTLH